MLLFYRFLLVCSLLYPVVISAQLTTVTIKASADLSITYPGNATANGTTMQTNVTTGSSAYKRLAIKFNIDSLAIPANAIIGFAELRLTPSVPENTTSLLLKRITSTTWTEASGTLNPTTTTSAQVTSTGALVSGKRVFNVKELVQNIVSGANVNNGWQINCDPESTVTTGNTYHSRSAASSANQPVLVIHWYIPYSITSATINHASSTTANDGSIAVTFANGSGNTNSSFQWYYSNETPLGSTTTGTTVPTLPNRIYGWYGLRIIGQYDTLYMAFLVGVDCDIVSIPFAPSRNYIDDATLKNWPLNATVNYGGEVINPALRRTDVSGGTEATWLRFRIWMDPLTYPVKADLTMYGAGHVNNVSFPNTSRLIQITSDWREYGVSRQNQPTTSTAITTAIDAKTGANDNCTVDISNFWNAWRANNLNNFGMRMELTTTPSVNIKQQYHSGDAASNRPKIDFTIDDATCDRTTHTLFKRELDAGYTMTRNGKLKFYFVEEYQIDPGKKIPLILYDENNAIVAAIDIDGNAIPGKPLLTAFNYTFDDNRQLLDLSSLSLTQGKFYILQLTHANGTKEYIQFQYTN